MLSNIKTKAFIAFLPLLVLCACDPHSDFADENIIGVRLDVISELSESENTRLLNIYDKTTNRVHTFDLQKNDLVQSVKVADSEEKHFIIASDDSSFFITLNQKEIRLHGYGGEKSAYYGELLKGNPVSSAYNKATNHLVVYDDLNSVALLKPSFNDPNFSKVWVGGPLITEEQSIQAGEILDDGTLVLSLINGSLVMVDIDASIDQKKWVYTIDSIITDKNIKWIGNMGGSRILFQNADDLALYDTATNTILDTSDLPENSYTLEYSKSGSPHVIYKQKSTSVHTLAFVEGDLIKTRDFVGLNNIYSFHQSRLDDEKDEWSYVGTVSDADDYFDLPVDGKKMPKKGRKIVRHRLSDMLVMNNDDLPDVAYLKRTKSEIFALYPSELGFAEVVSIDGGGVSELSNFNIPFINPEMKRQQEGLTD